MTAIPTQKSTIVRAGIGVWLRRFALALTEREAPALGARLAVRMWMTLPAAPAATTRPQLTPPGSRTFLGPGVAAESWGDGNGPLVYLMHGWAGYRGQLGAFVTPLTEAGFRVVALDAPGHGESGPGRYGRGRALMPDFVAALRAGIAHYGAPAGVVAHSLGASAVAIATLDGVPTNRLVLISPVANVMSGIDIFTQAAGVGPNVRARMPRRIERIAGLPTSHFDIAVRAAEREELAPMLVIHDVSDKRVPFDNAVLVAAAWPDSRLESTEGLGHLRILSDPAVIDTAVSYLSRQRQLADGALSVVALPAECLHVDRTGAGPLRHRAAGRAPGGISVRVRAPVPARVAPFGPAFGPVLPRLAAGLRRGTGDLPEALLSRYYTRRLGQVSNYLP